MAGSGLTVAKLETGERADYFRVGRDPTRMRSDDPSNQSGRHTELCAYSAALDQTILTPGGHLTLRPAFRAQADCGTCHVELRVRTD